MNIGGLYLAFERSVERYALDIQSSKLLLQHFMAMFHRYGYMRVSTNDGFEIHTSPETE